jgi:hypothetical protein
MNLTTRSGMANLPLHWGPSTKWLFQRMVKLAGAVTRLFYMNMGQMSL